LPVAAPRVLVVEDDEAMRCLLEWKLQHCDFDVAAAPTAIDALVALGESLCSEPPRPFALVISDLRMPEVDGLELLERLRLSWPALPVVLMTAFADADVHARACRLGACALLSKPFDLDEVVRVACELTANGRSSTPPAVQR
jgi:CheY-like chemotaxis protein